MSIQSVVGSCLLKLGGDIGAIIRPESPARLTEEPVMGVAKKAKHEAKTAKSKTKKDADKVKHKGKKVKNAAKH
jgi:hypothetical protein